MASGSSTFRLSFPFKLTSTHFQKPWIEVKKQRHLFSDDPINTLFPRQRQAAFVQDLVFSPLREERVWFKLNRLLSHICESFFKRLLKIYSDYSA